MRLLFFGLMILFITFSADARVCFIVDPDCQAAHFNPDMTSTRCAQKFKMCNRNEGLIGTGSSCYNKNRDVLYERCTCDLSYYKYTASDLGKNYEGVEPRDCDGETRYHDKQCRSIYKYALASDVTSSGRSNVISCPDGFALSGTSCSEQLKASSYTRYTKCLPYDYFLCKAKGQVGDGQSISFEGKTYYKTCNCADGYWLGEDGECHENGPSGIQNLNYIVFYKDSVNSFNNGSGISLAGALLQNMFERTELKDELSNMYNEQGNSKISTLNYEISTLDSQNYDQQLWEYIASGRLKASHTETIKIHTLLSYTGYDNQSPEWGISLYIDTNDASQILDLPITVFATLHDANTYRSVCAGDRNPYELEFAYVGWLSNLAHLKRPFDWMNNPKNIYRNKQMIYVSSSAPKKADAKNIVPFASMSAENSAEILGCHPFEHDGEQIGSDFGSWTDYMPAGLFGGDKCVNYVFSQNGVMLPSAIYDSGTQTLYFIESEVRAQVQAEQVSYDDIWDADDEAPGNFVPFNTNENHAQLCSNLEDTDALSPQCEIFQTLPYLNRSYTNGEFSAEELSDNPQAASSTTLQRSYLGDSLAYRELQELSRQDEEKYYKALSDYYQFFWENETIKNGRYEWSYPHGCSF